MSDEISFIVPPDSPEATAVLVFNAMGQVLALKAPSGQYALPGGAKESGETTKGCAVRMLLSQTGLKINKLAPCFARKDSNFFVTTYYVQNAELADTGLKAHTADGHQVVWIDPWQLCAPASAKNGEYCTHLLRALFSAFSCGV